MGAEVYIVVGMDGDYRLDLITPEDHADDYILVGEAYVDRVAFDTEGASAELDFAAAIESCHEFTQELIACNVLSPCDGDDIVVEILGISHAVQT